MPSLPDSKRNSPRKSRGGASRESVIKPVKYSLQYKNMLAQENQQTSKHENSNKKMATSGAEVDFNVIKHTVNSSSNPSLTMQYPSKTLVATDESKNEADHLESNPLDMNDSSQTKRPCELHMENLYLNEQIRHLRRDVIHYQMNNDALKKVVLFKDRQIQALEASKTEADIKLRNLNSNPDITSTNSSTKSPSKSPPKHISSPKSEDVKVHSTEDSMEQVEQSSLNFKWRNRHKTKVNDIGSNPSSPFRESLKMSTDGFMRSLFNKFKRPVDGAQLLEDETDDGSKPASTRESSSSDENTTSHDNGDHARSRAELRSHLFSRPSKSQTSDESSTGCELVPISNVKNELPVDRSITLKKPPAFTDNKRRNTENSTSHPPKPFKGLPPPPSKSRENPVPNHSSSGNMGKLRKSRSQPKLESQAENKTEFTPSSPKSDKTGSKSSKAANERSQLKAEAHKQLQLKGQALQMEGFRMEQPMYYESDNSSNGGSDSEGSISLEQVPTPSMSTHDLKASLSFDSLHTPTKSKFKNIFVAN